MFGGDAFVDMISCHTLTHMSNLNRRPSPSTWDYEPTASHSALITLQICICNQQNERSAKKSTGQELDLVLPDVLALLLPSRLQVRATRREYIRL